MDIRTPDFPCPECAGRGHVLAGGNDPQSREALCPVCDGRCDLTADEMLEHCMSELRIARKALRMVTAPYLVAKFRGNANHWLSLAKQARAKRLEQQHAGAAHITKGIDHAA